ncbi:MAG: hypothetical protein AAF654_10650 [Myxococcota bacterium]
MLLLSGCTGPCVASEANPPPREPAATIQWQVRANEYAPLTLLAPAGRLRVNKESGRVVWVASGERSGWLHRLELSLAVNRLTPGPSSLNLLSSRCRIRYLDEGRETEADFSVDDAKVEGLAYAGGQWTGRITVRCRKVVDARRDGKSYAEAMPVSVIVTGTGWAR